MLLQEVAQSVETLLGRPAVVVHPLGRGVESAGLETAGSALGVLPLTDQAGLLEHPEVLRDGLHADRESKTAPFARENSQSP